VDLLHPFGRNSVYKVRDKNLDARKEIDYTNCLERIKSIGGLVLQEQVTWRFGVRSGLQVEIFKSGGLAKAGRPRWGR